MKKIAVLILLGAAAMAPSISFGLPGGFPKCYIPDDVDVYGNCSTYATMMCSQEPGGTCTMTQWDQWYDYMYNVYMQAGGCPPKAN